MRAISGLILALFITAAAAEPATWSIDTMNRQIDQTNFIVGRGCSGTLVSVADRLILTNFHCITGQVTVREREITDRKGIVRKTRLRNYDDVPVSQNGYEGGLRISTASYVSEIVAEDPKRDLAVLRIRGPIPNIQASQILPEGDSITRGEQVFIVGNPLGEDATLGAGIVSHLNRVLQFEQGGDRFSMIQHSAGSAGGNSGGALYNSRGQIIGVPTASYTGAPHLGFAIPATTIREFLRENCFARTVDPMSDDARCRSERDRRPVASTEE